MNFVTHTASFQVNRHDNRMALAADAASSSASASASASSTPGQSADASGGSGDTTDAVDEFAELRQQSTELREGDHMNTHGLTITFLNTNTNTPCYS